MLSYNTNSLLENSCHTVTAIRHLTLMRSRRATNDLASSLADRIVSFVNWYFNSRSHFSSQNIKATIIL